MCFNMFNGIKVLKSISHNGSFDTIYSALMSSMIIETVNKTDANINYIHKTFWSMLVNWFIIF